jgi:hypothetical protein
MAAVRRQQEALSAAPRRAAPAPRRPAPAGRPPAPDAAPPPPRRRPAPASAPTPPLPQPGLLPPLLQPPAARRPPDAGAERESLADEARRVRSETDEAYARSLAEDQRKEEQRAAEDAAAATEAAHEQAIRDRREAARQRLAATPEASGPAVKRVRVRLPEGLPLARSFYESDPISLVRSFVYAFGRAPDRFALVHLGKPLDDDDAPLSSLGPGPVALMVTDLDA